MSGRDIRRLRASGTPDAIGAAHGSRFSDEIRAYANDRVGRSSEGTSLSRSDVLDLAEACLPAHEAYDVELAAEMYAMASAAGISPAEAVIVGGYTDIIDTVRRYGSAPVEDNCTAVMVPGVLADGGGWLAQTWDMHASATEHIVMLELDPSDAPAVSVFTTVGCLGQIGMNEHGLSVGINNLTAADGQVGVTWPFVVRRALACTTVVEAVRVIMEAPLAGGHNFLVMDALGDGVSIEAMPTAQHVVELGKGLLAHTNHCLSASTRAVEGGRPESLQESSQSRLDDVARLAPANSNSVTLDDLMALLRDERSICRRVDPPFDYESCGAVIMRPERSEMWACWGIPADNDFERFEVGARV